MTKIGLAAGLLFLSAFAQTQGITPAQANSAYPDTKANHWVYENLERLWRASLTDWGIWHEGKPGLRRADVVDAINGSYLTLKQLDQKRAAKAQDVNQERAAKARDVNKLIAELSGTSRVKSDVLRETYRGVADLLDGLCDTPVHHGDIIDLQRLADAFSGDLRANGVDVGEVKTELAAIDRRFALETAAARILAPSHRPFPDTKKNHWAYEAITRMKAEGLIVGIPNGNFNGGRLSMRHEMALQIHAGYSKLNEVVEMASIQIAELRRVQDQVKQAKVPDKGLLKRLEAMKSELRNQVSGIGSYCGDVKDLRRLEGEFGPDLTLLGVDLEEFKSGLDDLTLQIATIGRK